MILTLLIAVTLLCIFTFFRLFFLVKEKKRMMDSLFNGVVLLDKELSLVYANAAAYTLFPHLSKGRTMNAVAQAPQKKLSELSESIAKCVLLEKKPKTDTYMTEHPKFQSVGISAIMVRSGRVMLVFHDRTASDRMHMMGKNFVANASHELRTPITIIRGFTEMLQDASEVSTDMLEGVVDKILKNCTRMSTLVKNLITLADLDNRVLEKGQPVDLIPLLDGCHYTLLSVHPEVQIELLHNVSVAEVWGDPDLLELACMNLLENAVKYSECPAEITTTIESVEGEVHVRISDKGKGIPQGDLPHIFERFYTVDKTHSRRLGGAGLGLSIVQKIVSIHGCSLSAESEEGKGTSFIITAPLHAQEEIETPQGHLNSYT